MLDPQLLEAAMRRDDAAAVRDLLENATESERAACAKALKAFLTGPQRREPDLVMLAPNQFMNFVRSGFQQLPEALRRQEEQEEELNRDYNAWRKVADGFAFQLAALGLARGVAAAARAAPAFRGWEDSPEQVRQIALVLADRHPDWLTEFVSRSLTDPFGIPAWPLARALVRLGAIPRPSVPEYTTLMPDGVCRQVHDGNDGPWPTPAQALLADPGLLADEFWRLFTVPDAGMVLDQEDRRIRWAHETRPFPQQTWSQAIALLCAEGHLDRARVIDACLDAFSRDFNPNRVGWYAATLTELKPTQAEMADRAPKYLGLLSANSKAGLTLGQQGTLMLLDAGRLDPGSLLAASGPALLFPQKAIATTQLKLVGGVAAKYPDLRPEAAVTAAAAFGHERQDIQEAALKLIGKLGVPAGAQFAEIRMRAMDLAPSLAAQAAALGLLPGDPGPASLAQWESQTSLSSGVADDLAELGRRISALPAGPGRELTASLEHARRGGVPGPAIVRPGAGDLLPPPVTDPEELVQLLTVLIEDATDAIAVERALAGAVRLSSLPVSQRSQLAGPLLKRTERVMRTYSPFYGDLITSDLAIIANVWGGGQPLRQRVDQRERQWHMPGDFAVSSSGQALTMAGIFSARAWEAVKIIEAGQGGILLAEPETERGAISTETLLLRIRELAGLPGGAARMLRYDGEQALLRLQPGPADAGLWDTWALVAGQPASALRESHEVIQAPVRLAAVTGEPAGQPLRHSHEGHIHVLAGTPERVPAAPACHCWQLLTALAVPLRDHETLYGPSRYELRHYDAAVAGWTFVCPWQPEIAAAHLLRPLSDGLIPGRTPATVALTSMRHPGHALGPVGHLALVTGLSSAEADTRITAAELWAVAAGDGRLDPALAAAAIVTGVRGDALKLNRIALSLEQASHTELAARRIVETVCTTFAELPLGPANMHMLVELAARLGTRTGVPELPAAVREMAAKRGNSRIMTTARQLQDAASSGAPDRGRAAVQAMTALVARAEAAAQIGLE
jgi:hypothetical protein